MREIEICLAFKSWPRSVESDFLMADDWSSDGKNASESTHTWKRRWTWEKVRKQRTKLLFLLALAKTLFATDSTKYIYGV